MTPYEKYVASGDYMLVYSRYKDFKFLKDQMNFAGKFVSYFQKMRSSWTV